MGERVAAEVFPPGEFLKEELEARGWTQTDLAEILGRPPRVVNEIVSGKRSITPETAKGLGDAFGTGAQLWMNLESAYQLWRVAHKGVDPSVARRARLYGMAPVKYMIRRHWIEPSDSIDVLEKRILDFFEVQSVDQEPVFWAHAARKSTPYYGVSPAQRAWLFRARQLARTVDARGFDDERLTAALGQIRGLLVGADGVRRVPEVLGGAGIRLVVVEALPQTRIDGACFWLDPAAPVVVLSLRYDRIDWFWFTLLHELHHVRSRDGLRERTPLDVDLVGDRAVSLEEKPEFEKAADRAATDLAIPRREIDSFISRVRPLFSTAKIEEFARRVGVHPGIVVGQLQHRREIPFSHQRHALVAVRQEILSAAVADGWGRFPVGSPRKRWRPATAAAR